MGLFDKLFGDKEEAKTPRRLEQPDDLRKGDLVQFGFCAQAGLSRETYTVGSVQTQDLGGEAHKKGLLFLHGSRDALRLAITDIGRGTQLELGRQVYPEDVEQLFDRDAFIDLLDPGTGVNHILERIGEPEQLAGWSGELYRQEAGHNAYLYDYDYRRQRMPAHAEGATEFSYYQLVTDRRDFALEIQVFDGGRTDVWLLAYLPLDKLEEMWPGQG